MTDPDIEAATLVLAPKAATKVRPYMVLIRASAAGMWKEVSFQSGVTGQEAIQKAIKATLTDIAQTEATYVAVPARSWRPLIRKVETVEKESWA